MDHYLSAVVVAHFAPVFLRFTVGLHMPILPQGYAHFTPRVKKASRKTSTFILHYFHIFNLFSFYVAILIHG